MPTLAECFVTLRWRFADSFTTLVPTLWPTFKSALPRLEILLATDLAARKTTTAKTATTMSRGITESVASLSSVYTTRTKHDVLSAQNVQAIGAFTPGMSCTRLGSERISGRRAKRECRGRLASPPAAARDARRSRTVATRDTAASKHATRAAKEANIFARGRPSAMFH